MRRCLDVINPERAMFSTSDVLIDGVIAALLAGAVGFGAFPWARQRMRYLVAGLATFLGFIAWNLVISHAKATGLDVDAPVIRLSWQDVGSGVLAFAATSLALGLWERDEPAWRCVTLAAIAGLTAMIYDIWIL